MIFLGSKQYFDIYVLCYKVIFAIFNRYDSTVTQSPAKCRLVSVLCRTQQLISSPIKFE